MKDENPMKNIGFYGKSGNKGGYTMTEGEIEEVVRTKNLSVMQLFRLYYSTEPGKGHGKKKKKKTFARSHKTFARCGIEILYFQVNWRY